MDEELRDLERQAQTGDTEAEKTLILKQLRLGLEPYKKLYLRLNSEFGESPVGVPVAFDYAKNRWVPEMEGSTFYQYFLTYGHEEATLVAANSLGTDSEEIPKASWPPRFQEYLEEYDALFAEGFHLLTDIDVLETLRLSNLYLPGTYDKEEIQEYEEPPEYPVQKVKILIKRSREEVEILTIYTEPKWIEKLLGGFWELETLPGGLNMLVRDTPEGLQPNFFVKRSPLFQGDDPRLARIAHLQIPEENFQPGIQIINGPTIFTRIEVPEFESIDWSLLPWPWNEIAAEDPDRSWPAELEFQTLSDEDIAWAMAFMKPLSLELPDVTHFTFQGREAHLYSLTQCDKCGEDCIAPNSLKTRATRAELLASGLQELTIEPPELAGWSEEFGGALCDNCYSQETDSRQNPDDIDLKIVSDNPIEIQAYFKGWATKGNQLVGRITIQNRENTLPDGRRIAQVDTIEVDPNLQRQGIGTTLYMRAAQLLAKKGLYLSSDSRTLSATARSFWEKQLQKGRAKKLSFNQKFSTSFASGKYQASSPPVQRLVEAYVLNEAPPQLLRNPDAELRNLERQWHLEGSPDAYQAYVRAVRRAGLDPACYVCRKNVVPGNFLWCDQCQITVCYGCVTPCGHADCLSESEEAQAKARIEYHPDPLPLGHNRCPECADRCDACPRPLCPDHQDTCTKCDKTLCQIGEHTAQCDWCENYYCLSHLNDGNLSEIGYKYICLSCESVAQGG